MGIPTPSHKDHLYCWLQYSFQVAVGYDTVLHVLKILHFLRGQPLLVMNIADSKQNIAPFEINPCLLDKQRMFIRRTALQGIAKGTAPLIDKSWEACHNALA